MTNARIKYLYIFLLLFFLGGYFQHPVEYDNTRSRFLQLSAAVEFGQFNIDMFEDENADVSSFNGKTYSNKPIGSALAAAPIYFLLRRTPPLSEADPLSDGIRYLTRVITSTLIFGLIGVVMFVYLARIGISETQSFLCVLGYAVGTNNWLHGTLFSGHMQATGSIFFAFVLVSLWPKNRLPEEATLTARAFATGFLISLACFTVYTSVPVAGTISLFALIRMNRTSERVAFVLAFVPLFLTLGIYNWVCFDNSFTLSYSPSVLSTAEFAGDHSRGFFGISFPNPIWVSLLLFSPARGLFFQMPFYLLAVPGLWMLFKGKTALPSLNDLSLEAKIIALSIVANVLFVGSFRGWDGGWSFGPRYLSSLLPIMMLPVAVAFTPRIFAFLLFIAVCQIGPAVMVFPHTPETFWNPLVENILPLYQAGYFSENLGTWIGIQGVKSLIPIFVITAAFCLRLRSLLSSSHDHTLKARSELSWLSKWNFLCAVMGISIILTLAFLKTPESSLNHQLMARVAIDGYNETHVDELQQFAKSEFEKSE